MANRVVIVGAGPGGLATSILLAQAGLEVTVLERLPQVGGRTSTIEQEGFRFDLGPTFFLYPQVLASIFARAGFDLEREVPMVRLDPQYRLLFGAGGQLDATPDPARMAAAIAAISPDDAPAFARFLADNRDKFERFRPCIETPFSSWRDLATPRLLKLLPWLRPWQSLDQDLHRHFADPRIRLAFSFQSKYLGMSPFQCPSLFSILSFLEYEHGVFHPIGGCGALTQAMARVAADLGVDVRLGEPVESLRFVGKRAVGAVTARREYPCDALVINADFARAMERLVPDSLRRRWRDRDLAKKRYSCSTFMLYLGLEGSQPEAAHHTVYISADYERNLREIETDHVLSEDPSFYVQNACVTDGSLAPEGMSTLYVLVPVSHRHPNIDWRRERPRFRSQILRQLSKAGFEGVEKRIRFERVITPLEWERDLEIYRGATFNLAHNLRQMLLWRPHNRFEDLEGVYLVGGGTHPGSGLPVIFQSALISSKLLLEELGYDEATASEVRRARSEGEPPFAAAV
jgi:phytoene desaturase